ncbi:MAG: glutathione transferase GstA [Rhizobiales bacterium]|nr:glutathione transferase GstA [Hyphomicrobiales bacterium]
MELYFTPLACSLATRITLYETGQGEATAFHPVTLMDKKLADGSDYLAVNPKGQVPALRIGPGELLTEGAAVLQYVADRKPEAGLVPAAGSMERYRLQSALNFISTELHKQILAVIFDPFVPEAAKTHAREVKAPAKLALLAGELGEKPFLLGDDFTVADAYAFFFLTMLPMAGVRYDAWPALGAYYQRMMARPHVARALQDELKLAGRA